MIVELHRLYRRSSRVARLSGSAMPIVPARDAFVTGRTTT
jgi:hypothetical protein